MFFLKLMKPCKCVGLADYYCYCKFSSILPLQNLAWSVILYLFGIAIMLWFVPVKSLAYVVTKITVHVSGLKYWERKSKGDNEQCGNIENLKACNFLWLAHVEQK